MIKSSSNHLLIFSFKFVTHKAQEKENSHAQS